MDKFPGVRIVLIDDEPGVLRALSMLLQAMGCQVMPFSGPKEALVYLQAGIEADLILSDQRMPGMTGSQLFKVLKDAGILLPFILMSAHASESEISDILSHQSSTFLPKPFTPDTLSKSIRSVLGALIKAKAI